MEGYSQAIRRRSGYLPVTEGFRETPVTFDISEWVSFERDMRIQIKNKPVSESEELSGLCSRKDGDKITLRGSEFDDGSAILKKFSLYSRGLNSRIYPKSFLSCFKAANVTFADISGKYSMGEYNDFSMKVDSSETNARQRIWKQISNVGFVDEVFDGKHDDKVTKVSDPLADYVKSKLETTNTLCLTCYVDSEGFTEPSQFHAIAAVFVNTTEGRECYLYDPMYYVRSTESYTYALMSSYVFWKSTLTDKPLKIFNISKLCVNTPKGVHCSQYIINAEYCLVLSVFFIYNYVKNGSPRRENMASLQKSINDTYIVSPEELTRDSCRATNEFKLVFMGFLLPMLYCILDDQSALQYVKNKYNTLNTAGYKLLRDDIYAAVDKELKSYESSFFSGFGGKKRRTYRRKSKRATKKRVKYSK